jgi:thiamine-phosphate pyrophosphorylase
VRLPPLLLVADQSVAAAEGVDLLDAVEGALRALPRGGALVQLRGKELRAQGLAQLGRRLLPVVRPHRVPLVMNDRLDVARAIGADGVHLPEEGISVSDARRLAPSADFLIGASSHSPIRAGSAAADGANYVVVGPCWPTASKPDGQPLGEDGLAEVVTAVRGRCPLFAIGGVDGDRARTARRVGCYGVAAIRHWLCADDPGAAALELMDAPAS